MNTTKETIKAKYNEAHAKGEFGGQSYTHEWIIRLLGPGKRKRLLDIGCAQGLLLKEAAKSGVAVYGIDISDEAVAEARRNVPTAEILVHDAERLPYPDRFFDYITNIGTLEHLLNPDMCLKEMLRVLKDGGLACLMLPNVYYYGYIVDTLRTGKGPTSYQPIERFAARAEWERMLSENGFEVLRVHKYNKFNKSAFLTFIRRLTIPMNLSHHFVFICGRKGEGT